MEYRGLFRSCRCLRGSEKLALPFSAARNADAASDRRRLRPEAHCLETELKRGSERVILIGGDCPDVSHAYLSAAFQALQDNDLALGPATDSGYILIGLRHRPGGGYRHLFENIDWSSPAVLDQALGAALQPNLTVYMLKQLSDIDELKAPQSIPGLGATVARESQASLGERDDLQTGLAMSSGPADVVENAVELAISIEERVRSAVPQPRRLVVDQYC